MHDYSSHKVIEKTKKRSSKTLLFGFIALTIAVFPIYAVFSNSFKKTENKNVDLGKNILPIGNKVSKEQLLDSIQKITDKSGGTYSFYTYDYNSKEGFGINEKMTITAASVNKIAILASLYFLAEKKEVDLEKIIILQSEDIQDYGSGSIRYDHTGTPYSLKTLARLMMEKSDNTASYILGNVTIGLDKIQSLIDGWGLTQTNMVENKTSAYDMSILMGKIYKGEIVRKALTDEMLTFMDKSDFDDRIPKGLPEKTLYYHKTGDDVGKIHDVAIIQLPKRIYYLGVFSTDITNEETAKNNIADISKMVYEYENRL